MKPITTIIIIPGRTIYVYHDTEILSPTGRIIGYFNRRKSTAAVNLTIFLLSLN